MRYLLGEPRALFASANKVSPHAKGEDSAVVLVQYPHASALIDSSWASLSDDTPTEPVSDQTYVVEGSAGTIHLDHNATLHLLSDTGRSSEQFGADGPQLGFGNAFEHFVEGVTINSPFETDGAATRKTMELVFGAYQSAATGNAYHPGDPLERFNGKGERT
jgi:predicted dehydrogenase